MATKRKTTRTLQKLRDAGQPITMVTAYDATLARLLDESGVDAMLVGDSLGNVIQGHDSTLPVTLDQMIYHTGCVVRGSTQAHVIADMPFLSYGAGVDTAVMNAGRLLKEGGAQAVKLEGGREFAETVRRMTAVGIPVMGHLGFTPQSVHVFGGHLVQGRGGAADRLLEDARTLEEAGCYAIVLEMVPRKLATEVTAALRVPTIGIGAGPGTSGQVLVSYDLLGMNRNFTPKFLRRFGELGEGVINATRSFVSEVRERRFPTDEHSFDDPGGV